MPIQVNDVVETDGGRYVCVGVDPRGPTFAPEKAGGGPDLKAGTRRLMGPRVVALWKPLTRMTVAVDMSANPPDNWHEMRKHHPGMLLLYRVGDNYELFADLGQAMDIANVVLWGVAVVGFALAVYNHVYYVRKRR